MKGTYDIKYRCKKKYEPVESFDKPDDTVGLVHILKPLLECFQIESLRDEDRDRHSDTNKMQKPRGAYKQQIEIKYPICLVQP